MNERKAQRTTNRWELASALSSLVGAISALIATLAQAGLSTNALDQTAAYLLRYWNSLLGFDLLSFLAAHKFELTAGCGVACVLIYAAIHQRHVLQPAGVGRILIAFLSGASVPVGLIFMLVAFNPTRLSILLEFREFLVASGIALMLVSFIGVREVLQSSDNSRAA